MQTEDKKKRALDTIKAAGRINLDELAEKIGVDKRQLFVWVEEFQKKGVIVLEPHFLRAPDILASEKLTKAKKKGEIGIPSKKPTEQEEKPPKKAEKKGEYAIESYPIKLDEIQLPIKIVDTGDYVLHYNLGIPKIDFVTRALLDEMKRALVGEMQLETHTVLDYEQFKTMKSRFLNRAQEKLTTSLKESPPEQIKMLSRVLVNEMLGLGDIEYLLADDRLEEVVVNNSKDVLWAYHIKYGWVKTNIIIPTESMIVNYASRIAREVGREITHIEPLLDAHILSGDRINATLFPISSFGNTITIRKFSRVPWTVVHFIDPKINTINTEASALLWQAIEHELSILIAGGTASGKTSMLNALMPFLPPNQRILSMEDTRELNLPEYLQWIPMVTRQANPRGEGEVSMLDLILNALRMRPDRIIVGEVRAKRETEVLFEAMHTGHSVYGTFHAEQAYEAVDRITTPPMNIPPTVMGSLHLIVVQYRNRLTGIRRTFEIVELSKSADKVDLNTLYRWNSRRDVLEKAYPSTRIAKEIELFTGMSEEELERDIEEKKMILSFMLKNNIKDVNDVGRIVAAYYEDKETVVEYVQKKSG